MKKYTNSFSIFCEHKNGKLCFGVENLYHQVVIPAQYKDKFDAVEALEAWKKERDRNYNEIQK